MTWYVTATIEPDGETAIVCATHTSDGGVSFSYGSTIKISEQAQFVESAVAALNDSMTPRATAALLTSDIKAALTQLVP